MARIRVVRIRRHLSSLHHGVRRRTLGRFFRNDTSNPDLKAILDQVAQGTDANRSNSLVIVSKQDSTKLRASPEQVLESFANLDHSRSHRTGFPEVVFGQSKTASQVCAILDDMAAHINQSAANHNSVDGNEKIYYPAILATRVTPEQFEAMSEIKLNEGVIKYNPLSRIVQMFPTNHDDSHNQPPKHRIVVATAGTTDIPVAEEAAFVLEACRPNCHVDRIYDVGVAGLHRILRARPILCHPDVRCVIVCAGMDGALPSVVGGLVSCPVIAVPTSIGYGAAFGGVSPLLTMLNTCSPGVATVNIDNGLGAAAIAYKMISTFANK